LSRYRRKRYRSRYNKTWGREGESAKPQDFEQQVIERLDKIIELLEELKGLFESTGDEL